MRKPESIFQSGNNKSNNIQLHSVDEDNLNFYYQYIVETAQEGIWVLDPEGKTTYVNQGMAALLGTSLEDMQHKTFLDFVFQGDDQIVSHFTKSNPEKNKESFECRYRQLNGKERWVKVTATHLKDNDSNLIGIVAMHTDITERRNTENALQYSRENMGIIIDSVKDYAIVTIDKNRCVLSWNKGAEAIFGYREEEILGQLLDICFTSEDNNNHMPAMEVESAIQAGHSFDDRWHVRKDGSAFFASGVLTRLNQEGDPPKFIKICRDYTDRKELEEMLKKGDRHKNEFLATLAHELRNPLASILSGIEVLKNDRNPINRNKTQEIIERQVQQMIHLVNDLLDISRISLGKIKLNKQPLNLMDAIHLALETARPIVDGYKHALTVSFPGGPIIVDGDITRLSQVFLNILINSAKYTAPDGNITFSVYREDGEVVARIRDNGMGIPRHMLSSIFEMFEQIQDRSEYPQAGLGIGLSVVKQLVEMHGGHVEAHSEGVNKGSEFVVKLPVYQNQEMTYQPLEKAPGDTSIIKEGTIPNKKLLIVDDNTDAADMMEILLKKKGYTIRKAYNGKTGITTALDFDPEIVLLDLGLPDINGYEVLKALQEKLGKRFYLALSGWGQEEDLRRSKEAGFDHHLVKPIDINSLNEILSLAK